jgi:exosortase
VPSHLRFTAYTICLLAAHAGIVRALVEFSQRDVTASHVILVPFVSIALIYANRTAIFSSVTMKLSLGLPIVVAGIGLTLVGQFAVAEGTNALSVSVAGLAVSWIGGYVLFYGAAAARAALFPLAFLAFMIPPPDAAIDAATQILKSGSTETVAQLFTLTGTPYHRQDFVFSLPSFTIEVADACSGIRSSLALLLTSLIAGHSHLKSPWARLILALAVLPVALLKNAVRIVALTLLAMHVDPSFLTGQLHHEGGVVFFLLALGMMVPLFLALQRLETVRSVRVSPSLNASAGALRD